jgi:hypothetical protein
MKTITIKIGDLLFAETEKIRLNNKLSLNCYINKALKSYNILQKRKITGKCLAKESKRVKEDSISTLNEFEAIDPRIL